VRLNGWQRLWVFLTAIWLACWLAGIAVVLSLDGFEPEAILYVVPALGIPAGVYALGLGWAWVIRGFKQS
jgi:hypothetical protein